VSPSAGDAMGVIHTSSLAKSSLSVVTNKIPAKLRKIQPRSQVQI